LKIYIYKNRNWNLNSNDNVHPKNFSIFINWSKIYRQFDFFFYFQISTLSLNKSMSIELSSWSLKESPPFPFRIFHSYHNHLYFVQEYIILIDYSIVNTVSNWIRLEFDHPTKKTWNSKSCTIYILFTAHHLFSLSVTFISFVKKSSS
jgi:hypothetical protein